MKKIIVSFLLAISGVVSATETIVIASTYNSAYSGQAAMLSVLNSANRAQNKYNFILESHPGAQGLIALNYASSSPKDRLALIAAGVVDNFVTGKAKETDFVPVHAVGDACWAVVTNWPADEKRGIRSIRPPAGTKDLVLGVVGIGSVSHLAGLEIGQQVKLPVVTVVFKSGTEAFLNLASNNGSNMAIDSVPTVLSMKTKVSSLNMVAITCGDRHPQAPHVPTLSEQGLGNIPPVFNIILAPTGMPEGKRKEIGNLLDQATKQVGFDSLFASSGFKSAVFQRMTAQQFYDLRVGQIKDLRKKYAKEIEVDSPSK
jgi:tripartite-type tricarboxylate transporter receptor subunit TctC